MKSRSLLLILTLGVAGTVTGYTARKITNRSSDEARVGSTAFPPGGDAYQDSESAPELSPRQRAATKSGRPDLKLVPSTDTIDSLIALDDSEVYSRLLTWMMDASETDISAYWQAYQQKGGSSNDVHDLIFLNWARLNPQGAVAAATGTSFEHYAYWAWACHDPEGALAAAKNVSMDRVNNVSWGLGEFHPEWLREHFDELPEQVRANALMGLTKWGDNRDPLATLQFLREHDSFDMNTFKALAASDPFSAFDWLKENKEEKNSRFGYQVNSAMDYLLKSMADTQPELLKKLIDQTPAGESKRKMEATWFAGLATSDPDAALLAAKASAGPKIMADRFAALGQQYLASNPDKAFEMAAEMFAAKPDALNSITKVRYEGGYSGTGGPNEEVNTFIQGLIATDPKRLMAAEGWEKGEARRPGQQSSAQMWAQQDTTAYADWVKTLPEGAARQQAYNIAASTFVNSGRFTEAADWAIERQDASTDVRLMNVFYSWKSKDPEEARQWLDNAAISDSTRENILKQVLNQ